MRITRLAPSPTGALHLGNARTFLINWLIARKNGWRIALRMEDLDGPRVKTGADLQAIDDLRWLGLNWDDDPIYQTTRLPEYERAIMRLSAAGHAYPCICTRREVESAASAPHGEDGAALYPGTCRGRFASIDQARAAAGREPAIRFRVPDRTIRFDDVFSGSQSIDLTKLGDFVIAKSMAAPAYQLAVVVDDAQMNVTDVIRANDLLESAARQIVLYEALGWQEKIPRYTHLPLVVGADGRRLAKRHGDTRLSAYRQVGVTSGRILSLLARWCGVSWSGETTLERLLSDFSLPRVSRQQIIFTESDHAWLLNRERAT